MPPLRQCAISPGWGKELAFTASGFVLRMFAFDPEMSCQAVSSEAFPISGSLGRRHGK